MPFVRYLPGRRLPRRPRPFANQSGDCDGERRIRGGRTRLRTALYMPALVAVRHNPDLKAKYDRLLAAVLRSLLVLANALLA